MEQRSGGMKSREEKEDNEKGCKEVRKKTRQEGRKGVTKKRGEKVSKIEITKEGRSKEI